MCLFKKRQAVNSIRRQPKDCRVTGYSPDLSDYWCGLFSVGHVVPFFPFPSFSKREGWRGQRGADISVAEALSLQDVLGVLPLQLPWQHRSVGHAAEKKAGQAGARTSKSRWGAKKTPNNIAIISRINKWISVDYPRYAGVRRVSC